MSDGEKCMTILAGYDGERKTELEIGIRSAMFSWTLLYRVRVI
jgi:hypothetical protein